MNLNDVPTQRITFQIINKLFLKLSNDGSTDFFEFLWEKAVCGALQVIFLHICCKNYFGRVFHARKSALFVQFLQVHSQFSASSKYDINMTWKYCLQAPLNAHHDLTDAQCVLLQHEIYVCLQTLRSYSLER